MSGHQSMVECLQRDDHFVELHEDEREFLVDLALNESQRWIEAVTRNKFRSADFLESLEDGILLCELVERIWPRYLQLDEGGADNSFTRLYGQHTLDSFRAAAVRIGLEDSFVFLPLHIHAPERYICSADAQDVIQEALIRVTVTIYLLGWRAKETPTYPGPQLDLSAFGHLFQHFLRHLHRNSGSLCNKEPLEPDSLASPGGSHHPADSLDDASPDSLDETTDGILIPREDSAVGKTEMPSQELLGQSEDTYTLGTRTAHEAEFYRHARSGYYADSVGSSCDSACGSTSPSVADSHARHRSVDSMPHDEFVKTKDTSAVFAANTGHTGSRKLPEKGPVAKQKLKEDELEWQTNLSNWKSKRKSNLPTMDDIEDSQQESKSSSGDKNLRTFPAMMADRLQRHAGIPALYLDDNDNDIYNQDDPASSETGAISTSDKPVTSSSALDHSEKDSSSGISSPRSSRSLTSVSPPPSPTDNPLPQFEKKQQIQKVENVTKLPARSAELPVTPNKKIISLTRLTSGDGSLNDWKVLGTPAAAPEEQNPSQNRNIETSIKPFGEKLAMFQKAQTDSTVLDMNKCNYKELAKPELSLKDKLSVFERPLEASSVEETKDSPVKSVAVKSTSRGVVVPPDPVAHEAAAPPPSRCEPSGGLSRLLSKDLQTSNIRMQPLQTSLLNFENEANQSAADASLTDRFMEQIDGILGNQFTPLLPSSQPVEDFPPPPLPSKPPPTALSQSGDFQIDTDRENYFPTPPPPLDDDQQDEENDHSQTSGLTTNDSHDPPFRRQDSTKRIKSELLRRRSDFFGLRSEEPEQAVAPEESAEKPRPLSLHELSSPKAVLQNLPVFNNSQNSSDTKIKILLDKDESDDIEREQKSFVDSLQLEEERWRKKDQRPMRTQESAVASIVEEYRKELLKERESVAHLSKKEKEEGDSSSVTFRKIEQQPGILKKSLLPPADSPKIPFPTKTADLPLTVLEKTHSRIVSKSEENKRVVIMESFEKVTEERRVNGRLETSSKEEKRSVDHVTPNPGKMLVHSSSVLPPARSPANNTVTLDQKVPISQQQHYRDPSDGGYSSGRSDPGANVRSWLQHPSNNPPGAREVDTRDYPESSEELPPRPPMPTQFLPPTYSGPTRVEPPYQTQYASKPAPNAPGRMQPKTEPAKKSLSAADVQKHWLVQEAEMRRLTDAETRQRNAAVPPPLPTRTPLAPANQNTRNFPIPSTVAPPSEAMFGYENSSLGRSQSGTYLPVNPMQDQYSPVIRNKAQPREYFEEERYHPAQENMRTVVRSIGPASTGAQPVVHRGATNTGPHVPVVHRPNHLAYIQPAHRQPDIPTYSTSNIPVHLHSPVQQQPAPRSYYPTAPLVTQSVPNVLVHQQPKPYMTPQINKPATFNREPVTNQAVNSISAKWPCAHCSECLGRNPAMIVENLQLVYHVACFKCVVCGQRLSDGKEGADVRVRNGKLHCNSCLSDDGMQLSEL